MPWRGSSGRHRAVRTVVAESACGSGPGFHPAPQPAPTLGCRTNEWSLRQGLSLPGIPSGCSTALDIPPSRWALGSAEGRRSEPYGLCGYVAASPGPWPQPTLSLQDGNESNINSEGSRRTGRAGVPTSSPGPGARAETHAAPGGPECPAVLVRCWTSTWLCREAGTRRS